MKTKKQLTNRILSLVLTFVMVAGLLPMNMLTASAAVEEEATLLTITAWSWVDDYEIISADGTYATLPNAADWETLKSVLPVSITAMVDGAEVEIPVQWECETFPAEGEGQGTYVLNAVLPEGYALGEGVAALTLEVDMGVAENLDIIDSGTCGKNVNWVLNSDGVLTISGSGKMTSSPWGSSSSIKEVIIEEGVTSIRTSAFRGCGQLTTITVKGKLTEVGGSAFQNCSRLKSATFLGDVGTVGYMAFNSSTSTLNLTIHGNATSFGTDVFALNYTKVNITYNGTNPPSVPSGGRIFAGSKYFNDTKIYVTPAYYAQSSYFCNVSVVRPVMNITVTSEGNGTAEAQRNGEPVTSLGMKYKATLVATPAEGYYLKEYRVISGGITIDENNIFTVGQEHIQIKAIFEAIPGASCTVSFDANGGTGNMDMITVENGKTETLPLNRFENKNYRFNGWNTASDGTGTSYEDGAEISITENTTLYAQWEKITYSVTYEANGGTGTMETQTVEASDENNYIFPECDFTAPAGTVFSGWKYSTDTGTSTRTYIPGESIRISKDITVTAQWATPVAEVTIDGTTNPYGTLELAAAAVAGKTATIKLLDDVLLTARLTFKANNLILDLNNKSISNYYLTLYNTVSITGPGTLQGDSMWLDIERDATVTISEGVAIEKDSTAIAIQMNYGSKLILNGGSVTRTDGTPAPISGPLYSDQNSPIVVVNADGVTNTFGYLNVYFNITPTTKPTKPILTKGYFYYRIDNQIAGTTLGGTVTYDGNTYATEGANITVSKDGLSACYCNDVAATHNQDGTFTFTMPAAVATITDEPNHIHVWEYNAEGATITATCTDADGKCPNTNGGYVTISAPSNLTYTGSKIEAVVDNQLTTDADIAVTYTGKTTNGYAVNAGDYTACITLGNATINVEYSIKKATPTAEDFVYSAPTDLVYDDTDKAATVTVKDGIIGMGKLNVIYFRYSSGMWIDNQRAPHYPGRYKVGIWLEEGDNYNAVYVNNRIWLGNEFEIKYLTTDAEATISGTKGANGWYTSTVTLKAPEGYTISESIYETYGESLTFASEQNKTVTYYLKNVESGKVAEKTVELKIDLTDPTAEYAINDNGWRKFINFISFGIFCKDNADLSITVSDTMDSSVTVQYVVSTEKLTASEITDWNNYSDKVALNPKAKNYIYIKVTDDAGNTVIYESGVVVFADSTASAEIDYTKHSTEDVTAQIVFNGNTVKEVKYGNAVLNADHYTVTDSGIQFKADYLNTFVAGNYSFVVTYNPVGESWTESADGIANATIGTTTIELTVKKATLTITGATLADKTYDGTTSGTVSGVTFKETDKLVLGTDYTATVVYDGANAGSRTATVTVTLLNTEKANAYALESTTYTMDATIGKEKAPTLTDVKANYKFTITGFEADIANVGMPADAGAITYTKGNASVSGNATVTAWSVDENGKVTATISGGAKQDVITLPVTVSSDNYEDAVVNVVVTLGNRPAQSALTVKADNSVIYGNKLTLSTEGGSGTGDVTYSIVSGSENATIEGNVLTATKVGTVVITATKAGDNDYEPATSAQFTIEVAQRELVITGATATDRDYNGTANVTITNITLGNIYSHDDVSVTFNTTGVISSANKGKYNEVTVSGLRLDGVDAANYKLPESADGKYTVSTEVEISALDISGAEITLGNALTYNGSVQEQTVTGATKNGLTVTYTVSDNKNTNHGSYELTVTGTDNFTGTQTKAWSIAKRKITVTATAQTITYGKDITADAFTSTNVVNGHKLVVTLTPSTANVTVSGTITVAVNDITADGTSVIGNYDVSVSSGKLTIQPDLSAISDLTTENVTSADKADIEAVKDMMSKADYANADEGTKAAWDAIVADCDTLLAKIEAVADEIDRVTDKTGSYNAGTVNSDDAADLNKLAADIKALTDSKNLTNEERTELTALAETVAALQKVITDTTAENKRIAEELAKFDKDTVNSDSSDELAQLLTDIEKQLDSTNLTEAEKKALEEAKTAVTDMQKVIADTAAENDRISDEVDKYSIDTVKSSDEEALNTLLDEIKDQLTSTHLSDEEISELNGDKTAVEDLLAKIKGTDELIDKLTGDVGSYKDETVKSTDKDALEQIIEDAQALIDSGNVTDSEKETLKGVQEDAQALIDVIDDTAEGVKTITDNAASYNNETVKSTDKDELEQVIKDIDALLDGDNLTDAERESLEEVKQTVQDLIDAIDDTADEIKAANDTIGGLDEDTVKSTDKETIEQIIEKIDELLDGHNLTEDERKALEDTKAKAEDLLDAIDDAAKAPATENTEKVKDVTTENVTPDDKTDLENAKADLEKALEDNGGNYTEDEKKAIEDEIKRIEDALEVIGNVEAVEELIDKLPENITKNDEDAIKAADDAYNALSDYEKSLVDKDAKKALDDAKAALAELKKPADPNSPQTGDNSHMMLWITLLFISGGAVITLTVVDRKRKTKEN